MPNEAYPIADKQDFNAWKLQHPNAFKMLDTVILMWRGSSARTRKHPGRLAAYSQREWSEKSGLSGAQTKRALKRLEIDGLIIRVDGTFAGATRCSFYQPTELALTHKGRPGDPARLKKDFEASEQAAKPYSAPLPAPFITSLPAPSMSSTSTTLQQEDSGITNKEEKGRAGKKMKFKMKLKKPVPANEDIPQPPADEDDSIEAGVAKLKQGKLAKLLVKFPIMKGSHEKAVRHPYEINGAKWATWSLPLITERYAKYLEYVNNWYGGKNGKRLKPYSYDVEEIEVDLSSLDEDDGYYEKLVS